MAEEEKQLPENEDWLNDFDESTDDIESVDDGQADFDELFESFESEDQGETPEPSSSPETVTESGSKIVEEEDELDQASIDALLGNTDDEEPSAPQAEMNQEADLSEAGGDSIDQSAIDALLGNSDDEEPSAPQAETNQEADLLGAGSDSIDQSDIDELLGSEESELETPAGSTDDYISGSHDESGEDTFEAEAVDFEEILDSGNDQEEEFSGDELDEEFDFGDELDDFENDNELMEAVEDTPLEDLFGDDDIETSQTQDISEEETVLTSSTDAETLKETSSSGLQSALLAKLAKVDRKKAAIGAIALLVLIGGAGLILNSISGSKNKPAIVLPGQEGVGVKGDQLAVNMPPQAKSSELSFAEDASEVEIKLDAIDPEGAKLVYEISQLPEHGRLSGEPPNIIYHPDSSFAGKDTFKFRANDGTQASQPMVVSISGPDISSRLAGPILIEPKRPVIKARNQEVAAVSTEPFIIDWREIWSRDNEDSMKNASVEVSAEGLKGKLVRLDKYRHKYIPDPFSEGIEEFSFRFKKRGVASKFRKMEMKVASGNPEPDLIVAGLDKESYAIGETVVIDASMSRDDKRESLIFEYEQLNGVPVHFNYLNQERSKVSFIMPSSFYTTDYPEPVIKLTAIDETGKNTSKDIKIKLQRESFLQASLWDGLQQSDISDPECPTGNCPGSRLP